MGVAASLIAVLVAMMAGQGSALAAAPCQGGSPSDWQSWGGGSWTCNGTTTIGHSNTGDSLLLSRAWMSDFDFSADVGTYNREATLAFRFQDPNNGYLLVFMPDGLPGYASGLWLVRRIGGLESFIWYNHPVAFPTAGNSGNIHVVATGAYIQIWFNGVLVGSVTDGTFASGMAGYRVYGDSIPDDAWFANGSLTATGNGYNTSAYPTASYPAGYVSGPCATGLIYNAATHNYEYPYGCTPNVLYGGCDFFAYSPAGLYAGAYSGYPGFFNGYGNGCLIGHCGGYDGYNHDDHGYGNGGGYWDSGYGGNNGYGNGNYDGCYGNGGYDNHDCGNNGYWDDNSHGCHGNGGNNGHDCGNNGYWDSGSNSCHGNGGNDNHNCGNNGYWDSGSNSCHGNGGNDNHNCGNNGYWDSGSNSCHGNGGNDNHNCGNNGYWDSGSNSCHGNGGNNSCNQGSYWDSGTNSCHKYGG
jgi:hypothetical protein